MEGVQVDSVCHHHQLAVRPGQFFFLLDAAWVRSRAERTSVSYTKVTSKVAWTSHNLQVTNKLKQQNCGSNKFRKMFAVRPGQRKHSGGCGMHAPSWSLAH